MEENVSNLSEPHNSQNMLKRRPHKKSRNGCTVCKQRRVKCDETKPQCQKCLKKNLQCQYLTEKERNSQKGFKFKDMSASFGSFNNNNNNIKFRNTLSKTATFVNQSQQYGISQPQQPFPENSSPNLPQFTVPVPIPLPSTDPVSVQQQQQHLSNPVYQNQISKDFDDSSPASSNLTSNLSSNNPTSRPGLPFYFKYKPKINNNPNRNNRVEALLNDYLFLSDIIIDLNKYFHEQFVNNVYPPEYTVKSFDNLGQSYTFVRHIYIALCALEIYYICEYEDKYYRYIQIKNELFNVQLTDEEKAKLDNSTRITASKFMKKYPQIDKYFMLQISLIHKAKCLQLLEPLLLSNDIKSILNKEASEAITVSCSLISLYLGCSPDFKFMDLKFYQSFKSIIMLNTIEYGFGWKDIPQESLDFYTNLLSPEEVKAKTKEYFPKIMDELFKPQYFEKNKIKHRSKKINDTNKHDTHYAISLHGAKNDDEPANVKKNSKLVIQSILNAFSDDEESESESESECEEDEEFIESNQQSIIQNNFTNENVESSNAFPSPLTFSNDSSNIPKKVKKKYNILKIEQDYEISDDDFDYEEYSTEDQEMYEENKLNSGLEKNIKEDSLKCQNFSTYVYKDENGQEKLRYEQVYKDLIELITNHIILYGQSEKKETFLIILGFGVKVSCNDNILYLLHHKDPRILIIFSYFFAFVSSINKVWWVESLINLKKYLYNVLPENWHPWVEKSLSMIDQNDWRK